MTPFPREYLWFVERVLREYPANKQELKNLELAIEACCRGSSIPGVGGSSVNSQPERVTDAKLQNKHYQKLTRRIKEVNQVWAFLTKQEREIADMFFWQDMNNSEIARELHLDDRYIRRIRARILRKASKVIIPLWIS